MQALACIEHFQQYLPALIIVQSNLLTQWKGEIDKFCKGFIAENELCVVRKASDIVAGKVCLVPYSILQRLTSQQKLKPEQFGIVVCDESHNLKNKDSQKTVVAVPFLRRATIAICLSGIAFAYLLCFSWCLLCSLVIRHSSNQSTSRAIQPTERTSAQAVYRLRSVYSALL